VRRPRRPARSQIISLQPPIKGLMLNQPPGASDPLGAEVLENGIPTKRGVRVRGGLRKDATVGSSAVLSLFSYRTGDAEALFAATASSVYNISGLDPDTAPSAAFSGQSSGYYSAQQIGTAGGDYLYIVNGANSARLYDGATWTAITGVSTPAITGVTTSLLSHVWLYRSRLFFIEKDTMRAWYLPVDSVGGAALDISLAGIFQRGGSLLFGATWSLDSGEGLDDKCVFVSTEGEVAIYEGNDPAEPADWIISGRYDVAKPLGVNAYMQAGGDLLIATVDGIVPLSQIIQKDPAALSLSAVTRPIESLWNRLTVEASEPIQLLKWADRGLGIVTLPESDRMLLVNLQTGAWAAATGWVANCAETYLGMCYIGRDDGSICAIDETGADDGEPYTMQLCWAFNDLGDATAYKRAQLVRPSFFAPELPIYQAGIAVDYTAAFPPAPTATEITPSADYLVWDSGAWDEKLWWSASVEDQSLGIVAKWRTVTGAGFAMAPTIQITSGQLTKPNIEILRLDLAFETGGSVV
jgi:hypothetical protein